MTLTDLETLSALLRAASAVVDQVAVLSDSLLERMARLFSRMPAEDREPILAILEREVGQRVLARSGSARPDVAVGPPNPNARLYTRVFGPRPVQEPRELMAASVRAARMMLLERARLEQEWEATTREAFRVLSADERAAIARHHRDLVAVLERIEAEGKAKAS
jgi:hypothetical protein